LATGVWRLVANNPGPFTYKGTNTYLVGTDALAIIDPGPDDEAHIEAIVNAVAGRPVTHILITHTHRDHIDGLPRLKRELPDAVVCGFGRRAALVHRPRVSGSGHEVIAHDFAPDVVMRDGDAVSGPGWQLTAIYTPGHAIDHLCFELNDRRILFSGDHVMAWNTSVVAPPDGSMADYLASLQRLTGRNDDMFLPGHGGRVEEPERTVRAFLVHRQWREQAILGAIREGHSTIQGIVALVYRGIDPRLVTAACLSVQAHVEHLIARGLVRCDGQPTFVCHLSAV
jgi:glyoxylase-like metal-dependent hydrolase (beta-lactamase superfamily II)